MSRYADCTSFLDLQMEEELDVVGTSAEIKARMMAIERSLAALTTASDIIELRVRLLSRHEHIP